MNIFFLHIDPKKAAEMHVNSHTIKMILESCQLLCSVHHVCNETKMNYDPPYKLTHKNHPSAKWARESLSNYKWLIELAKELCKEYTYRYGKIHKCERDGLLKQLETNLPEIPDIGFTVPLLAMPDVYKTENPTIEDAIESYRQYYYFEKRHIFAWKKREIPAFISEYDEMFN
jgi:hypothetical protein